MKGFNILFCQGDGCFQFIAYQCSGNLYLFRVTASADKVTLSKVASYSKTALSPSALTLFIIERTVSNKFSVFSAGRFKSSVHCSF